MLLQRQEQQLDSYASGTRPRKSAFATPRDSNLISYNLNESSMFNSKLMGSPTHLVYRHQEKQFRDVRQSTRQAEEASGFWGRLADLFSWGCIETSHNK